jgi:hypothetical protein
MRKFIRYNNKQVPRIEGAGGGKGNNIAPNSLFSTDILFVTTALGEGPLYRINPNGPQDIQIQDSSIDDLINLDSNGLENTDKFLTVTTTGTVTQDPMPKFGDEIITPQVFASAVNLKKGNVEGVPRSEVLLQETSANDWDAIRFIFLIEELFRVTDDGDVLLKTVSYRIRLYNSLGTELITTVEKTITEKTDTAYKFTETINIPKEFISLNGYRFSIDKTSDERDSPKHKDTIRVLGWDEIKYVPQAYPRTALVGYALKAANQYTGGVPNFTSMVKGLLIKVPSNYNQPILANGEIDWRELEVGEATYTTQGYRLQRPGTSTILYGAKPILYTGTWDGTFVYSWSQNPVWIVYDILTNRSYGLGIPEDNIDKYKFYQVAQYCDACDSVTGEFIGVSAVADGSYRYKPRGQFTSIRENQIGLPKGTIVNERRFILDVTVSDQEKTMDILNKLTATFRSILVYAGGKISLATDMPDEYPVMLFNETNIKQGSFQIAGIKESEVYTGVDVSYVEPTNHYKREVVRLDLAEANDGRDVQVVENIASLDLTGVTRRSQAIRLAQYQIASSRYLRRTATFITSTEALSLAPGDVVSVAMNGTGIAYGFGGKVSSNSSISDTNVFLEHYTVPSLSNNTFIANTYPLALRVIKLDSDRMDLYIISNTNFALSSSDNVSTGIDLARVSVISRFDPITKTILPVSSGFTSNNVPTIGDLWTIGEFENPNNYYTNKSGKLFKVTGINRDSNESEVTVTATEYVSNVYIDSDSFINYEPTAYVDIISPFSIPPTPVFTFTARPRTKLDGTVIVDGILNNRTESLGYGQKYETEYYVAKPDYSIAIANIVSNNTLTFSTAQPLTPPAESATCIISGKNGFVTPAGDIRLLCNNVSSPSPGIINLTLEGLRLCIDENFDQHVLAVNDGILVPRLKGADQINIPVREKANIASLLNFVGYQSDVVSISREIVSYDLDNDTVTIQDSVAGNTTLSSAMLSPPFYVNLNQILAAGYYSSNSVYIQGTEINQIVEGELSGTSTTIELPTKPRSASCVRFLVDGKEKASGQYTVNINKTLSIAANVEYVNSPNDTTYRVEICYYTVPTIEVGDRLEVSYGNSYTVINSSYDTASAKYNAALTSNSIYRIELDTSPKLDLSGFSFVNTTQDPFGALTLTSSNTFTIQYNANTYPGVFNLANNGVYTLDVSDGYEKLFLTENLIIPELPLGITSVKARNRNLLGRTSPYVTKTVLVEHLPIQKVENLTLEESMYREQTGGVAVRITCSFDHIIGQEVTDYEISYKLTSIESVGSDDGGDPLTSFNTVKIPATGVDTDNRIRFTINNINRGLSAESNSIIVRVTPLNKSIRGITAISEKTIIGKTSAPLNVIGFTGGQQNDVITFFWSYARINNDLFDLDLKEVIITRVPGIVEPTLENFLGATPVVTVSVPSGRKSVPIETYGTFTYLIRTRDTSGNLSNDVVGAVITTSRAQRATTVAAYNEDNPSETFIPNFLNNNAGEFNFPSFANSNTGGIAYDYTSAVDNANGSSSGWSVISGSPTDLLAIGNAEYITQIRDFGQTITGQISIDIEGSQGLQSTYNDQQERVLEAVSETSTSANVLVDVDFGGIGHVLGFANANVTTGRYDSNNRTWMTGPANGNVWAIRNFGQFNGDLANANSYALIAGLINANAIALGSSYFANGEPTGSNSLANVTSGGAAYTLVNMTQYSDTGSATYAGTLGSVTSQTFIRSTTTNPYYANGNINVSAFSISSDGWVPYEVGTKSFRYFQIKYVINNNKPDEFNFTLDKFRYSIDKEQTVFTSTVTFDASPKTIDITQANFLFRPVINYTILDQIDAEANPSIVVTTAASNQSISFKLVASDGTGQYQANSTANVMITAIGV